MVILNWTLFLYFILGVVLMYVFLDSNFCYTDPFMQENLYNRILIELAEAGYIALCMSEVVRKEILNNFEKELRKHFEAIENNKNKLMQKYIRRTDDSPFEWKLTVEDYLKKLDDRLTELEVNGIIDIIPYSNEILPELVERSIKRIKPFSESKLEFRDAIIWLSYVEFVKSRDLDRCYFITANTEDFYKNDKLHPDLEKDSPAFVMYKNAQEFIQNSKEVKDLQKEHKLEMLIEDLDYPNNPHAILAMLEQNHYFDKIYEYCSSYIFNHPHRIPLQVETFETEWLEMSSMDYKKIEHIEAETVLGNIIVTGYVIVEAYFEVNERNPSYEPGDEEFLHMGSDEVDLIVKFSINLNEDLEIVDLDLDHIEVD